MTPTARIATPSPSQAPREDQQQGQQTPAEPRPGPERPDREEQGQRHAHGQHRAEHVGVDEEGGHPASLLEAPGEGLEAQEVGVQDHLAQRQHRQEEGHAGEGTEREAGPSLVEADHPRQREEGHRLHREADAGHGDQRRNAVRHGRDRPERHEGPRQPQRRMPQGGPQAAVAPGAQADAQRHEHQQRLAEVVRHGLAVRRDEEPHQVAVHDREEDGGHQHRPRMHEGQVGERRHDGRADPQEGRLRGARGQRQGDDEQGQCGEGGEREARRRGPAGRRRAVDLGKAHWPDYGRCPRGRAKRASRMARWRPWRSSPRAGARRASPASTFAFSAASR
jgi:hypothetical protein